MFCSVFTNGFVFCVSRNTTSALPLLSVLLMAVFLAYQLQKLLVFYLRYLDGCAIEIESCYCFWVNKILYFSLISVFAIVANNSVAEEFGGEEKNG